jgi:hypothetical protein
MDLNAVRVGLAGAPGEFGFRIEQVHVARTAILDQLDHSFGAGGKVARTRPEVIVDGRIGRLQQIGEHEASEAETGGFQNRPSARQPPTV